MTLAAGTTLGPYQITGSVGVGGMGEVYRAHDPRIGRDVAVKVLPASLASDPERLRRFEQEVRATGLLNHPNILTIHDTGSLPAHGGSPGAPFIVTELLEGHTLREALREGPVGPAEAVDYALQIARGLAAAHAKGIVHRDLKPENVFILPDGRVKILDFGIAKLTAPLDGTVVTAAAEAGTQSGALIGTIDYMSPEQARGEAVDRRSDLFGWGLIFYEMLAGVRPFAGGSMAERLGAVLRDDPDALPPGVAAASPGAERIARRCLEKSPDKRFQSADDLVWDLESLSPAPSRAATRPQPRALRTRAFLVAAAVVVIVVAAGSWFAPPTAVTDAGGACHGRAPGDTISCHRGHRKPSGLEPGGQPHRLCVGRCRERRHLDLRPVRQQPAQPDGGACRHRQHAGMVARWRATRLLLGSQWRRHLHDERARR
jgi:eukaryotic-like serine/threonine-protein kinase